MIKWRHLVPLMGILVACSEQDAAPKPDEALGTAKTTNASETTLGKAATCGQSGLPDCPLQTWMKANLQAYLKSRDTNRLARALDELAEHEPPGFSGWAATARKAADAARAGELDQVRVECRTCHDNLRSRYRSERRSVPLF
jgi:hypothetical protein